MKADATDAILRKKIDSDQEINALRRLRDLQIDRDMKKQIQGYIEQRIKIIKKDCEERGGY